jgi:hypothetical protein
MPSANAPTLGRVNGNLENLEIGATHVCRTKWTNTFREGEDRGEYCPVRHHGHHVFFRDCAGGAH